MAKLGQSNRPADTAFKQQKLKSWQPLLTPKNVIPIFLIIGIIFIPIGITLYLTSESIKEIILDYTDCNKGVRATVPIRQWSYDSQENVCTIDFAIFDKIKPPVYMYYRLTNFYQNHRDYFKSYCPEQLKSSTPLPFTDSAQCKACAPFRDNAGKQYYPCGLIANSFFSDEFSPLVNSNGKQYTFNEEGISWSSDKDKYKTLNHPTEEQIKSLIPPPEWQKAFPQWKNGYTTENFPRLAEMERFQVWMRVAGLPNFRKLYGKNKNDALNRGNYTISINYRFDVDSFGGTKSIIISNVSAFGGKNPFLGVGYFCVGSVSFLLGIVFLIRNMISPRKLGDVNSLSYKTQ